MNLAGILRRLSGTTPHAPSVAANALHYPVRLTPASRTRGRVLFSYLHEPLLWTADDAGFLGHSNAWESRQIASILVSLGYAVDAISWDDAAFVPRDRYDAVFDICYNLQRVAPLMASDARLILHCTGSDPFYQNAAELRRIAELEARRGVKYTPKRIVAMPELASRSLDLAHACSLIGSEHTLRTYPPDVQRKMTRVPVTGSRLGGSRKVSARLSPREREFLWFFGGGAVHKGLDLVLEVFQRNQDLTLNIVSDLGPEPEFLATYADVLAQPNVRYHGYLTASSRRFADVIDRSFAFLAPTCSEAISSAAVTCMQAGLLPIVSLDSGLTLPDGAGFWLPTCSIDEIDLTVRSARSLSDTMLSAQIEACRELADREYSRDAFSGAMRAFLESALRAS